MTQTFNENVFVDGNQDAKQLRVQGHTTQTEALQTWENSAGNVQAQVTGDGRLQMGDDLGLATPDALVEAHRAETSTTKPKRGIHSLGKITTLITDLVAWMVAELELLGTAGVVSLQTAFRAKVTHNNTGSSTTADIRAGDFEAINQASNGQVGRMTAVHAMVTNQSGAALKEAVGLRVSISDSADGIEKPYAIYAEQGTAHFGDELEMRVLSAAPENDPEAGFIKVYPKLESGIPQLFAKNAGGVETRMGGSGGTTASIPPGIIWLYGGSDEPEGWLHCDGRAMSRVTYQGLYEKIDDLYTVPTLLATRTSDVQGDLPFPDVNHNLTPGSATLKLRFYRSATVSSVNISTNQLTFAVEHTFSANDRVRVSSTGTLPTPLAVSTDYYVLLVSPTAIQLSSTSGGPAIDLTAAGSGTITINGQDEVSRTGMTIQAVVGAIVTVSGGSGGILPQANVAITVECDSGQFFLPDMRGRVPVGTGAGMGLTARSRGQMLGEETHLLTVSELPAHNHPRNSSGYTETVIRVGSAGAAGLAGAVGTINASATWNRGDGAAHNNMQPSLVLNYIIKT